MQLCWRQEGALKKPDSANQTCIVWGGASTYKTVKKDNWGGREETDNS